MTTKNEQLIGALNRARGISQDEAAELLGWQPKTVRAAISILKTERGLPISTAKDDRRGTVYRIGAPAKTRTADSNRPDPERFPHAWTRDHGKRWYYHNDTVASPHIGLQGKYGSAVFVASYETAEQATKLWSRMLRNRIGQMAGMVTP